MTSFQSALHQRLKTFNVVTIKVINGPNVTTKTMPVMTAKVVARSTEGALR